ncbi:hypothetical protein [Sporosarcina sp. P17b]|uniref:hypothetical protein n=1 Tax=Sporosarcina sp. P17b TaxID=2048260 RepID=UPI000C16E443|nr:hypothetical protein [Sporosarcina sp. P17b]PIC73717.1 hypothetical protein CSV76_07295 [Sporosarcina sp. P17b]
MKKNHLRRNISNIFVFFFFVLIAFLCMRFELLNEERFLRSDHLDILTINSIFAGFLFTSLGIMVSFSDKKAIANKDKNGYMDKYYNSIYVGLLFLIISILFAVIGFAFPQADNLSWYLTLEQLTLIGGIIYFIKSCWSILKIIQSIRSSL